MGIARKSMIMILSACLLFGSMPSGVEGQLDLLSEGERNDSVESARILKSGMIVKGSIEKDDQDWYSFLANKGDVVRIGLADSNLVAGRSLYDPNKNVIQMKFYNDYLIYEVSESGEHFLRIDQSNVKKDGSRTTGDYYLLFEILGTVEPSDLNEPNDVPSEATKVPSKGVVHGVIDRNDQDWVTFEARKGDKIEIISMVGPYGAIYRLFDVDGNRVNLDLRGLVFKTTAPKTGQYFLRIRYNEEYTESQGLSGLESGNFGQFHILFNFDVETQNYVDDTPEQDGSVGEDGENGINTPPPDDTIDIDSPAIIAAIIGGLATIIAAILSRR